MKSKKVIALTMTAALSLSALTGCGGKDSQGSSAGNDKSSAEESSSAAKEESPEEGNAEDEPGGAEEENTSDTITFPLAETMTFTAFAGMNGDYTLTDNIAMQKSLVDANINIEFTNVLGADLEEKRNLVLNSGEYPDIFIKSYIDADK
ncbi:hypothetical protein [uncultured Acetatifactor sp.]|nr:hypothetical protein [uncultured Acetatifactor sp.]